MIQPLQNRSILRVKGVDALQFLQSITTNELVNNDNSYNYLLSPQGKYLYDFFVSKISDQELLIDVDSSCAHGLTQKLNLYKLRRDVVIEDASANYVVIYSQSKFEGSEVVVSYQDPRFHKLGFRTILLNGTTETSLRAIEDGVATSVGATIITPGLTRLPRQSDGFLAMTIPTRNDGSDLYLQHKYQFAIPDGVTDLIFDRSIPSHFGGEELFGISFTKGCYVGQEVISRAKYQGVIRQKIFKIISGTEIALEKGAEITDAEGTKIGIFCSNYGKIGIALLNEEKYLGLEEKIAIIAGGFKVQIEVPQWRLGLK